MKNVMKISFVISALFAIVLVTISISAYAESEPEPDWRPLPELQNEFMIDGNLVPAISIAIAEMRRYPPLSNIGKQIGSYDVLVTRNTVKGSVSFTFVARDGADGKSLKSKGAVESRIEVRLRDLKVISKRLFN